jgi:hypothetical protein
MRTIVLDYLASTDPMPVRGATVQAHIAAMCTPDVRALMQNARANGRNETQLANAVYRAFRQLKGYGQIMVTAPATYALTDAGRDAAKAGS